MRRRTVWCVATFLTSAISLLFPPTASFGGEPWFKFNVNFIQSHYEGGQAFGALTASKWAAASKTHDISCGGNDGELHIGAFEGKLTLDTGDCPLSARSDQTDGDWGVVAELSNAALGTGPTKSASVKNKPITFTGYFHVWNEGHGAGQVFDSNPHHVFELHPAWTFKSGNVSFKRPDLIQSIPGYRGYGATVFKPVLKGVKNGTWPKAYHDGDFLFVSLAKAQNFYQLPIIVRAIEDFPAGHAMTVDVYSNKAMTNVVYSGLRCITIAGSPFDDMLGSSVIAGSRAFLFGCFSINLKQALEKCANANSVAEAKAKAVPEAVEYLVFDIAVMSCK